MPGEQPKLKLIRSLCPACGICCSGILFKDVKLQRQDKAPRLRALGLPRRTIPQPCPALGGDGRCEIYSDRPAHCRHFDCALLLAVAAGAVGEPAVRRTIGRALALARAVRSLLRRLGEDRETLALDLRFRRLQRVIRAGGLEDRQAVLYGRLTLRMHELNMLLRRAFYPRPGDPPLAAARGVRPASRRRKAAR
jgi:uncharacterized protein